MLAELWDAADGDARRSAVGAQWLAFTLAKLGKKFGRINVPERGQAVWKLHEIEVSSDSA
jgi:hypothetical protein